MSKFPCDGGCNWADGASEECSAHGRPPAQIWGIVADVTTQRDAALARIARVEAVLASSDDGGKSGVSQQSKSAAAAFAHRRLADAVRAALTEGEPSE